jgi:hypothetical protein
MAFSTLCVIPYWELFPCRTVNATISDPHLRTIAAESVAIIGPAALSMICEPSLTL